MKLADGSSGRKIYFFSVIFLSLPFFFRQICATHWHNCRVCCLRIGRIFFFPLWPFQSGWFPKKIATAVRCRVATSQTHDSNKQAPSGRYTKRQLLHFHIPTCVGPLIFFFHSLGLFCVRWGLLFFLEKIPGFRTKKKYKRFSVKNESWTRKKKRGNNLPPSLKEGNGYWGAIHLNGGLVCALLPHCALKHNQVNSFIPHETLARIRSAIRPDRNWPSGC